MKRRTLLGAGVGLVAAFGFARAGLLPVIPARPDPSAEVAAGWIHHRDGAYVLWLPRAEIGQNISAAMKHIACVELGVDPGAVRVELVDTGRLDGVRATVGSESIQDFALPLALACASLRDALAAGRVEGEVEVRERPVSALRSFVPGGDLAGRTNAPPDALVALAHGEPLFVADRRPPGCLYGRVLRAPANPAIASRPRGWQHDAAMSVPGAVAVVDREALMLGSSRGLGIVARTPGALEAMAAALAVVWSVDEAASAARGDLVDVLAQSLDSGLSAGGLAHVVADDDIDRHSPADVDLVFTIPLGAHAQTEARTALAEPDGKGGLIVHAATQDAFYVRDMLVDTLHLDEADVRVQPWRAGGAFGGRTTCTVELEVAVLAIETGQPVKVQWTREQELRQAFHRPPSVHRVRARVVDGQVGSWWHAMATTPIIFTNAVLPGWLQGLVTLGGDKGARRGLEPPYRFGARRIEYLAQALPVPTGPWRGLGAGPNGIALECAMDECAWQAGEDPVAFRLAHIEDPRLAAVLRTVAPEGRVPAPARRDGQRIGAGVACGIYKGVSLGAVSAEVSVADSGRWRLVSLNAAHDCGKVFDADQVRAQCEGNLVWGIGMVRGRALELDSGVVTARSFADLDLPTMMDVPDMAVTLLETDAAPTGAGETLINVAAAAVLNALRAATGVRVTRLPVDERALRAT